MVADSSRPEAWPYITEFKTPRWALFSQIKRVPDYYIPYFSEIERKVKELEQFFARQSHLSMETIYWYCILKKYTFSDIPELVRQKLLITITENSLESPDEVGFLPRKNTQTQVPTINDTFFAISSLHILDELQVYLQKNPEFNHRDKLIQFVMNRNQRGSFVHCMEKHCQKCKDKDFLDLIQLQALGILDLMGYDLLTMDARQLEIVFRRIRKDERRYPLKLLVYRYIGKQGEITDSDIKALFLRQKKDGGFNFLGNAPIGNVEDTFWITTALDAYKWLGDYPKGKIYSFLAGFLKSRTHDIHFRSESDLRDTAMVLVLLSYVWGSLIEEIETTIFEKLEKNPAIDFDKFVEEVGIHGAEQEVISYINTKYQFKLQLEENDVKFPNYLRNLERLNALFSKMIYERVKTRSVVDLTELITVYNRNRSRKDRASIELLQEVIDGLIKNNFVTGKIEKKKKGFVTRSIFIANRIIKQVISISAPLNIDQIEREKGQIREFERDIENMTLEIQKSSKNIFREVESLIMVDEIPLARQRLTSLIKNSLFDAEFFNKNIDKFQQEFTYLDAKNLLKEKVFRWERVFGDLRRNFKAVEDILLKRIEERENSINERSQIEELEHEIQEKVTQFSEKIGDFKEKTYESLKTPVEPNIIQDLFDNIQDLQSQLKQEDDRIADLSQKITPSDKTLKEERKEAVSFWITKRDELYGKITEIRKAFNSWYSFHKIILSNKKDIIALVTRFKENIGSKLKSSNPKQSGELLDHDLNEILESLNKESKNLSQQLNSDSEQMKIFPGLRQQVEREWSETQQFVETTLNKARAEILIQIEAARENKIQEDFSQKVDDEIQKFQEFLAQGRNQLQRIRNKDRTIAIDQYASIVSEISNVWRERSQFISQEIKKNKDLFPNFEKNCQISIYKFNTFEKFFEQEFEQLKEQSLVDIIKQEAILSADSSENNVVDITELAKRLNLNKKELRTRMQNMLSDSIIEGRLFETCEIFVRTDTWTKIEKIKDYIQQKLTGLQEAKNQVLRLYKTAVENHTLTKTSQEIHRRITLFEDLVKESRLALNNYVSQLNIPPKNKTYQKETALFESGVQSYRAELTSISENVEKLAKLQNFMDDKLDLLKNIISSQIDLFEQKISQEKSLKKVAEDFESEVGDLRRNINTIEKDVQTYCRNVWRAKSTKEVEPILNDLKQDFFEKKEKIINRFENSQVTMQERINNRQNAVYKTRFEKIIEDKQEFLNKSLGKIQRDIERKIITREFKSASETLTRRVASFNKSLNKDSKLIKEEANKIGKVIKGFPMKNKYLLDKWKLFRQELALTVKEKVIVLEADIIQNYIKMTIKVFKDEYVTFSLLAEELHIPKDIIKERLITLIGEGSLPGKIYLELEIYYEKPEALENINRESVEVIKATSVRTYLFYNRLLRFAKLYGPIFVLFSGLAGITTALFTWTNQNFLVFLLPISVIIGIFLNSLRKKRAEEKDYEQVVEPKD